jgi:hypothetical protein
VTISLVPRTRTLKRIEGGVKWIVEILELKGLRHESLMDALAQSQSQSSAIMMVLSGYED